MADTIVGPRHTYPACPRPVMHDAHTWRETGGRRRTFTCPGRGELDVETPDARVVIRREVFTPESLAAFGWRSLRHAAAACGIDHSSLSRVLNGHSEPGGAVIAALMHGTGHRFDALFTVEVAGPDRA